ncbi:MAG: hypothetical protein H7Z75_03030 [Ferruginibacter sp.]|nr:hypothetical protein [Cytophagales bacterium]
MATRTIEKQSAQIAKRNNKSQTDQPNAKDTLEIPCSRPGLQTYFPEQIKQAGGTQAFEKLVGYQTPVLEPIKISDREYQRMLKMLGETP